MICPHCKNVCKKYGFCHRSLQNQPAGVESKPATLRCFIHIKFLDASKGLFNLVISAGSHCSLLVPNADVFSELLLWRYQATEIFV